MPLLEADALLTDIERATNRRRLLRRLGWISVSLALLAAVAFGARPAIGAAKAWQARRQAAKAFLFLEEGKMPEARAAATAAYALRPTEPQALRAVAAYLARNSAPQALEFWDQLRTLAPATLTRDDRRQETALALALGDNPRADRVVAELLVQPDAASAIDWLLAAQAATRRGAFGEANTDLLKILQAGDANGSLRPTSVERLRAAILLLNLPTEAREASATSQAWTTLGRLARGSDGVALDTLVLLASNSLRAGGASHAPDASLTGWSEAELAAALAAHPLARTAQRLLALDLQAHVDPAAFPNKETTIDRGVALCRDGDSETLLALGAWLLAKGQPARLLAEIPLERAAETKELFLQRLDALAALGKWEEIRALLRGQRFPLEATMAEMYLARCAAQLGETTRAENHWRHAVELAGEDAGKLFSVGEYAEKNGAFAAAAAAYQQAAALAPRLRAVQTARLRLAQSQGDSAAALGVLREMLALWPDDPAVANDAAYLGLLLGQIDPAQAEAT
ncbi:MAG: hypothetical protein JO117_06270, partial [Verrucomicrobia bacterium]|nr:hypothetical protein [Verrucomicrobiota bacterium]